MSASPQSNGIIDCHVHLKTFDQLPNLLRLGQAKGIGQMNLLSVVDPRTGNGNSTVLAAKARHPDLFYAFGGLSHHPRQRPRPPRIVRL